MIRGLSYKDKRARPFLDIRKQHVPYMITLMMTIVRDGNSPGVRELFQ